MNTTSENDSGSMKPPRSKLRGITRKGIVCETPRFLTLFPLAHNALWAGFGHLYPCFKGRLEVRLMYRCHV